MMRKPGRALQVYAAAMTAAALIASFGTFWGWRGSERTIAGLLAQRDRLVAINQQLDHAQRALAAKVDSLKSMVDAAYRPRAIRSTAAFPILRGMARPGDTVETFAAREHTTPEIVRVLNPWLKGTDDLQGAQMLWIPTNGREIGGGDAPIGVVLPPPGN